MLSCWSESPHDRPEYSNIVTLMNDMLKQALRFSSSSQVLSRRISSASRISGMSAISKRPSLSTSNTVATVPETNTSTTLPLTSTVAPITSTVPPITSGQMLQSQISYMNIGRLPQTNVNTSIFGLGSTIVDTRPTPVPRQQQQLVATDSRAQSLSPLNPRTRSISAALSHTQSRAGPESPVTRNIVSSDGNYLVASRGPNSSGVFMKRDGA
ncbi:hypothetical protein SARC_04846 [Sphaeroforma arctica JP610]|uniref:Uncharacterized protein n=1 Tax=Sphaeroforma arctica JP610 TaxID=667725 RepID=A0A0L0G226_9EUKA|nr:hypothetical protein SARC_04846 [Sphaeroforma arctica JP610]KNC82881.1 hypothetical protein SARC_04846 [Sphaeroforma arctica JP610]|eukprot:XP_014156783.1 hypothetical protein SARC_04846 [Sphaeroforma arctica JP610]